MLLVAGCSSNSTTSPTTTPASATTVAASNVNTTAAVINGTVNPNGFSAEAYFEWGTSIAYGTTTTAQLVGSGTTAVNVMATLTGLTPTTLYHYRLVASDGTVTINGSDLQFTTATTPQQTAESFSGTLAPQSSSFFSFPVYQAGMVNITLTGLTTTSLVSLPNTVVGVGFGTPGGQGCSLSSSVNTTEGAVPQLNLTSAAGISCVEVFDIGNLTSPADFLVNIVHP
jgi:hypothetical protein